MFWELLFFVSLVAKKKKKPIKTFSPEEKIKQISYQSFIVDKTINPDFIKTINSFEEISDISFVGTDQGIYIIRKNHTLIKYLKFDIKSNNELFDGQDSIVKFDQVKFIPNNSKSKLLVQTGNGILFQLDIKSLQINWLNKFVHRIETATYSHNDKEIAIGTGYDFKSKSDRVDKEPYSTLFLIDSNTGKFKDYFEESASIKKILYNNNSKLLVAYDWGCTDSYLWSIENKSESISKFCEDQAFIYDIIILDSVNFATVNGNGISKWEFDSPEKTNLIYSDQNTGSEQILKNKISNGFILVDYPRGNGNPPNIKFLNNNLKLKETYSFSESFIDIKQSENDSVIIGLSNDKICFFNYVEKKIKKEISLKLLNKIIK